MAGKQGGTAHKRNAKVLEALGTVSVVAGLVLIYELLTDVSGALKPLIFPGFSQIVPAFQLSLPKLMESLWSSICLLIPSYLTAAFLGITLGLLIGTRKRLYNVLKPIFFALTPMPPSMLTPYFITILPTFYLSSFAVIFIGSFWPFLNSTISGVMMVEKTYLENAQVLHYRGFTKLTHVILPAACPLIFSGASMALNFSFALLVVAEMFATDSGLGFFVQYAADYMDFPNVIAGLLFMGLLVIILSSLLLALKKKVLFWHMRGSEE